MVFRSLPRIAKSLASHGRPGLRFALRAWMAAPAVEASLRFVGLRKTLAVIDRLPRARVRTGMSYGPAGRVVGWAFRAHPLLRGQCLERALVQYALHRIDGQQAKLVVGVRKDGGFEAHAWIEPDGAASDFEPLMVKEAV